MHHCAISAASLGFRLTSAVRTLGFGLDPGTPLANRAKRGLAWWGGGPCTPDPEGLDVWTPPRAAVHKSAAPARNSRFAGAGNTAGSGPCGPQSTCRSRVTTNGQRSAGLAGLHSTELGGALHAGGMDKSAGTPHSTASGAACSYANLKICPRPTRTKRPHGIYLFPNSAPSLNAVPASRLSGCSVAMTSRDLCLAASEQTTKTHEPMCTLHGFRMSNDSGN